MMGATSACTKKTTMSEDLKVLVATPEDIENFHESNKAENAMDFTQELLKSRLHYAETPVWQTSACF
jgi:hypothetical protein